MCGSSFWTLWLISMALLLMCNNAPSEQRNEALKAAFAKLPTAMRELKREVTSMALEDQISVVKVKTAEMEENYQATKRTLQYARKIALLGNALMQQEAFA